MLKKQYKYFFFDLDRTLWDFETNSKNNIYSMLARHNLGEIDKESFFCQYRFINNKLWALYEQGKIQKEYLRWGRFDETLKVFGKNDCRLAVELGEEYLGKMPEYTTLMPGAEEVLLELKEKGAIMAIVTNGFKEVQKHKLKNSGILHFFDSLIISEDIGVKKPSPIIFRKALESINAEKEKTLMIGDDFVNDIEGAMIFGIDQFYYNYNSLPCDGEPTYESGDLRDLLINQNPQ